MKNDKGMTLVEVVLTLFILSIVVLGFSKYYYLLHRLISIDTSTQQMGEIAKTKIEELKSNRIYIEDDVYLLLELENEAISFEEGGYKVDASITSLHENEDMNYINVRVSNKIGDSFYNLVTYINLSKNILPNIYEELPIEPSQFNY